MPLDPNKLSHFWQELKRRKVVKAITMYGATAFIVIEASDIILPRLGLPNWTVTFLIILIIVGFFITVVLSWIFDTTPEGIRITPPAGQDGTGLESREKSKHKIKVSDVIIVVLLGVVAYLLYPKIFHKDRYEEFRDEQGRITLAVMPFENLTGDTSLSYFQRGIASYLSNDLGNSPQLLVRDEQSMLELTRDLGEVNYAGFNAKSQREIATLLKAETYITGSYQGRNGNYLILVDLIDSKSGEKIWTDRIRGNLETSDYFNMADSLSLKVKDHLEIKAMKESVDKDIRDAYTSSAEAYRYFIEGVNSMLLKQSDHAIQSLRRALAIDPGFAMASFYIAWAYSDNQQIDSAALWTARAWESRERLPSFYKDWLGLWNACYVTKNIKEVRRICDQLKQLDTDSRLFWFDLGITQFSFLEDYQDAVNSFARVEKISKERKDPWKFPSFYDFYVQALHKNGEHVKEGEVSQLGQQLFPDNNGLIFNEAICAVSRKDWEAVFHRVEEFNEVWDDYNVAPKVREHYLSLMFEKGGELDSALYHFRRSFELDPEDPYRHRALARFLIQYDLDMDEAIGLLETVNDTTLTNDFFYNHNMGMALLKQGKPEQALPLLKEAYGSLKNASPQMEKEINEAEEALKQKQGGE
jgi:tetratricopeptide (TPR) repeat protein